LLLRKSKSTHLLSENCIAIALENIVSTLHSIDHSESPWVESVSNDNVGPQRNDPVSGTELFFSWQIVGSFFKHTALVLAGLVACFIGVVFFVDTGTNIPN
jgi:hypothetical protein